MQPIVNGLETEYADRVAAQQINADTSDGSEIFRSYSLFGHPSYLILDETGEVLWRSVGELQAEVIIDAVEEALENR